jgi:tetratricopeptide (TPR) repeat protein
VVGWYSSQPVPLLKYSSLRRYFRENLVMRGHAFVILLALAQAGLSAQTVPHAVLDRVRILDADGSALMSQKLYAEAEVAYRAALRACESPQDGSRCDELPVILSNLGAVYFHTDRFREAELQLVRALTYWRSDAKPSEDLRNALYNLAAVYRTEARYGEAAPLYERALTVNDELVGPMEPSAIPLLNGIALLDCNIAEYTRARQSMERAISIIELSHAENTPEAGTSFATLGAVLEAQGSVNEAETWFFRALEIRERLFGQNDPVVADTRVGLALVYSQKNRLAEAAELDISAIAAYQERRETTNLPVALNNLGRIRVEQGHPKEAEQLFRRAIALWEHQLGPTHPNVAAGLTSLGLLLCSRSKFNEAEPILRRARDIDVERFPANHPRIANDLNNMGVLALDRKHYAEAEAFLQAAEAILEKCLPPSHPENGKVLARLAEVYFREARPDASETLYRRALEILEQAWGPENPLLLPLLEDYSAVLRSRNNNADAARVDARIMKIRVRQALRSSK